jgi:hypothetical protein
MQAFGEGVVLKPGTQVQVLVERDTAMKVGEAVRAKTVYPVYLENQLVLPAGSELVGKVSALTPAAKAKSRNAKLGGDFTPLHEPKIEFDEIVVDGKSFTVQGENTGEGAQVVRFVAADPSAKSQSLTKRLWTEFVGREKEAVRTFTAPGRGERARRLLYSELPYHPELLLSGTQFAVELKKPLSLTPGDVVEKQPEPAKGGVDRTVKLVASLTEDINSKQAVPGTKVHAIVTEPLYDANHQLKVPQGSELFGEVTQSQPAGKWGRGGTLRFSFRELRFPAGFTQRVHGAPASVDADQNANLQMDAEGGVKPGPKGFGAPLVMGLMAATAMHDDETTVMHTGGASNGFALIGRAAALASKSNYVGAAFGCYGTSRAVYSRYIVHGKDVDFPKNTRIEVVLGPERVNALKPPE